MVTRSEAEDEGLELLGVDKKEFTKASKVFVPSGQAQIFQDIQPLFYDKNEMWWLWNYKAFKWEIVDEVDILNMICDSTGQDIITPKNRTIILNSLKQEGRKKIPQKIKESWIQYGNIFYDYYTGEKIKVTANYFATNPLPFNLHAENKIDTPIMDKIFEEWVGKDCVKTLYEIIAFCTLCDYPINRLFCFIGSGLNGKTKFLELLRKFTGNENCCTTELDTLLTSRFEITRLHKKLVCMMGETNFNEISKTSILKKLTGGDLIGFEYKNKNPFDEKNYAKIIIATNNLPITTDKTIGFYRRWMIIDFPNQFTEAKDILKDIPEEEYNCLASKCCLILKDLVSQRKFTNEGTIEERTKKYEDKSNPLEKFIKECIVEEFGSFVFKWEFQERLNQWCKENRFREISDVIIAKKMKEMGIIQAERSSGDYYSQKRWRAWVGLNWKNGLNNTENTIK